MKEGPLERYMLKYLIFNDKEYLSIKENNQDIIFETHPIYFAFGFVQNDRNEVVKISQSIQRLHRTKKPFILTLFLGVVNHWTTLIIKSDPGKNPIFIFLDSSETDTLNLDDLTLSKVVEEEEKEY